VPRPLQQPGGDQPRRARADDEDVLGTGPAGRQPVPQDALVARDEGAVVGVEDEQGAGDGEAPLGVGTAWRAGGGRRGRRGQGRGGTAGEGRGAGAVPATAAKLRRESPPSGRATA
jgi:hypothetical protein